MSFSVIIDKHAMYVKYAQVMNSNTKYTRLSADRKDFFGKVSVVFVLRQTSFPAFDTVFRSMGWGLVHVLKICRYVCHVFMGFQ